MKAAFITIEGVEGAGKSTAIQTLCQVLDAQGVDYVLTREPGGTEIAEAIRTALLQTYTETMCAETELLLMTACRYQHVEQVVKPALAQGKWVLSDRFLDASYAYQGGGRQLGAERIDGLYQWLSLGVEPDLTLLLDLPVEQGLERIAARGQKDRIEEEDIAFFERVRMAYHDRISLQPDRFCVIDASQSEQQVSEEIQTAVYHYSKGMS